MFIETWVWVFLTQGYTKIYPLEIYKVICQPSELPLKILMINKSLPEYQKNKNKI